MSRIHWSRIIQAILVLALPLFLLLTNVRIVTGHWFVHWEYGKQSFPSDPYGLSTAGRISLAETCVDYLASGADISLLADLRLPTGGPAFNQRELRHMFDVQIVYGHLMTAGIVAALLLALGIGVLLASTETRRLVPPALLNGSLLTLVLLGAAGAYMVLSWNEFFTTFHRIFFEGNTWLFDYSDTLIRLFPVRFWMDVALLIVGLLIVEAVLIGGGAWMWMRRLTRRS